MKRPRIMLQPTPFTPPLPSLGTHTQIKRERKKEREFSPNYINPDLCNAFSVPSFPATTLHARVSWFSEVLRWSLGKPALPQQPLFKAYIFPYSVRHLSSIFHPIAITPSLSPPGSPQWSMIMNVITERVAEFQNPSAVCRYGSKS